MATTTTQKQMLAVGLVMDKLGVDTLEISERDAVAYNGGVEAYFDPFLRVWKIRRVY